MDVGKLRRVVDSDAAAERPQSDGVPAPDEGAEVADVPAEAADDLVDGGNADTDARVSDDGQGGDVADVALPDDGAPWDVSSGQDQEGGMEAGQPVDGEADAPVVEDVSPVLDEGDRDSPPRDAALEVSGVDAVDGAIDVGGPVAIDATDGRRRDVLPPNDGPAKVIVQYPIPTENSQPWAITVGPDNNLWVTERLGNQIARVVPATGEINEYSLPNPDSEPYDIVTGPDGNLWFTEYSGARIGRIPPSSPSTDSITEYSLPSNMFPGGTPAGIESSNLGSYVWFADYTGNRLGRISTTTGTCERFSIPTANAGPAYLVSDPASGGGYWFTEYAANRLGRVTISGTFTEPATFGGGTGPRDITVGPDGDIWFTEYGANQIGRIATTGTSSVTPYQIPTANSQPLGITAGPDGNVWFTEHGGNNIGRITPTGTITEFAIPAIPGTNSQPAGIVTGPDGNLWFVETGANRVSRISP